MYDENNNHWFTKDRSETASNRVPDRALENGSTVENLGLGLHVYHNTFSLEDANRYIETLESKMKELGDKMNEITAAIYAADQQSQSEHPDSENTQESEDFQEVEFEEVK